MGSRHAKLLSRNGPVKMYRVRTLSIALFLPGALHFRALKEAEFPARCGHLQQTGSRAAGGQRGGGGKYLKSSLTNKSGPVF